jgi:hypothetical protein
MINNRKTSPDDPQHQGAREGNYKNIEESVNNASYFDDSYASKQEDEITEEKIKTEKQQREGKKGRGVNH